MKSNFKHKLSRTITTNLFTCVIIVMIASCDTIREDMDNCGLKLQFKDDYNMQNIDLFSVEVDKIDVFVFDSDSSFLFKKTASAPEISSSSYLMNITGLKSGKYYILVWAGLSGDYVTTQDVNLRNMYLTLQDNVNPGSQSSLWYGYISDLEYEGDKPEIETVSLVKDINNFFITLRKLNNTTPDLNANDITFEILSGECNYNYLNLPPSAEMCIYKSPKPAIVNPDGSLMTKITTMRLFKEIDTYLKIYNEKTSEIIAEIDLMKYIHVLYENGAGKGMGFEEYLDRECRFTVEVIYDYHQQYISIGIIINDWVIWFNETGL